MNSTPSSSKELRVYLHGLHYHLSGTFMTVVYQCRGSLGSFYSYSARILRAGVDESDVTWHCFITWSCRLCVAPRVDLCLVLGRSQLSVMALAEVYMCAIRVVQMFIFIFKWPSILLRSSEEPKLMVKKKCPHLFIYLFIWIWIYLNQASHRIVFFEQRPGDELEQRQHVDQPLLLQAQQTQHFAELLALHAAVLKNTNTYLLPFLLFLEKRKKKNTVESFGCYSLSTFQFQVYDFSPRSPCAAPWPTPWSALGPPHWRLHLFCFQAPRSRGCPSGAKDTKSVIKDNLF